MDTRLTPFDLLISHLLKLGFGSATMKLLRMAAMIW